MGAMAPQQAKPLELFRQTMRQPAIVCDIDGVLAFLAEAVFTALNATFGTMYDAHKVKTYWVEGLLPKAQSEWLTHWLDNPWSYVNLVPDQQAISAINKMHEAGLHITIATDRQVSVQGITGQWLDRWGVKYNDLKVGRGNKEALANQHGPERPMILFDDSPERIPTIPRPGVQLDMPLRPWSPPLAVAGEIENVTVFDDWRKILIALGLS